MQEDDYIFQPLYQASRNVANISKRRRSRREKKEERRWRYLLVFPPSMREVSWGGRRLTAAEKSKKD